MRESEKDRILVRPDVLRELLIGELPCTLSTDDEAHLYGEKVQQSSKIAQHFMILKALENGVAEKRLANALSLNVLDLRRRRDLLDGICREAVFLLRNGNVAMGVFTVLRKMKPARQVEAAEHMIAANTFSITFARALLSVTKAELLVNPIQKSKISAKYIALHERLGRETERLVKDLKEIKESYGRDVLALTIFSAYIRRMLANPHVERHLARNHSELLGGIREAIADQKSD